MLPLAAAVIAIVTQDQAALRASASSAAPRSAVLSQGEALEVRGARRGFLQVYDYHRERGGYVLESQVRQYPLAGTDPRGVLEAVRLLRDLPGFEALGIGHAALYLKLAAPREIDVEVFDAIGTMADRLARRASSASRQAGGQALAGHLEAARSYGLAFASVEEEGRTRTCYEGEAFRQVLKLGASAAATARAVLGLTRPGCETGSEAERQELHERAAAMLDAPATDGLPPLLQHRLRLRRVVVWSTVAFDRARRGASAEAEAAEARALRELALVPQHELAESDQDSYTDAAVRAGASRSAIELGAPPSGRLSLAVVPRGPGETCLALSEQAKSGLRPLIERCTYGQVWPTSVRMASGGKAVTVAVQPLAAWRELWVLHEVQGAWTADVLVPATETGVGYVEWAGFVPGGKRLLLAREARVEGRFTRSFELVDLDSLAVLRKAQRPQDLTPFYRWQAPEWRSQTIAIR